MKKYLALLVISLVLLVSCSPKLTYFYRETPQPQVLVDSLMGYQASDFRTWRNMSVIGVNDSDSTRIVTYLYRWTEGKQLFDISVTEFVNLPEKDFVVKQQERRK